LVRKIESHMGAMWFFIHDYNILIKKYFVGLLISEMKLGQEDIKVITKVCILQYTPWDNLAYKISFSLRFLSLCKIEFVFHHLDK